MDIDKVVDKMLGESVADVTVLVLEMIVSNI